MVIAKGVFCKKKNCQFSSKMLSCILSISQPRLRCLLYVIKGQEEEHTEFLLAVIPEIILCTKEVNSKARALAFTILVEVGNSMIRWSIDEDRQGKRNLNCIHILGKIQENFTWGSVTIK